MSEAKKIEDPAPPAPRNTTSSGNVGAIAARAEETPTIPAPSVAMDRSPYRSTRPPATRSKTSRMIAKALISRPTAPRLTPKDCA
jgi:hypothetical protein